MKKFGSIICSALLLLGLTVGSSAVANGAQPSMTVTFIDCDQGDSILVESNGHRMLVDGGKAVHAQAVEDCLRSKSISTLDYVVASHPDEDHIGGLPQIYNRFQVNYSYYSPYKTNTKCYKNYLSAIKSEPGSKAANPTANSRFQVGGTTVQVLSDGTGAENANDASLVLKVQCGNRSLLLTGDISSTVEQSLVNSGTDLQTDILKVAHHGSAGSSSASFLAEAAPKYAAISVGAGNSYGHPTAQALQRLQAVKAKIYRTDQMGTIQMQVQNSGIQATTQKGSAAVCKHRTTKKVTKTTPASFNGDGCAQTSAVCTACGYTKVTSAAKIAKVSAPKLAKTVYTYNGKVQNRR